MSDPVGGDHDADDAIGEQYDSWADSYGGAPWTPDCWHASPEQLIEQARSQNMAGFSGAFANAGKHSNPPAYSPDHSRPI